MLYIGKQLQNLKRRKTKSVSRKLSCDQKSDLGLTYELKLYPSLCNIKTGPQ